MEAFKKTFTLSRVFDGLLDDGVDYVDCSDGEDHFGMHWSLSLSQLDGYAQLNISCDRPDPDDQEDYCIEAKYDMILYFKNDEIGSKDQKVVFDDPDDDHQVRLVSWDHLQRKCSAKGEVKVELQFEITRMDGVVPSKMMDFGEPMKELSNVALVVGDQKFYVLREYLSIHSTYFKSMFFGNFKESNKSEVVLESIDKWEFQKFLEVLHGEDSLDDDYFEAILRLVDMFDASIVRKQCEKFLMENSKKPMREKLKLAVDHKMENVKAKCLNDINTAEDIRFALPMKLNEMDPSLLPEMFKKTWGLLKKSLN